MFTALCYNTSVISHPLYEGVDWNVKMLQEIRMHQKVALFTRAWIEIMADQMPETTVAGRPLHEGVDWNCISGGRSDTKERVVLFTRAWIEIYSSAGKTSYKAVALFTRVWIEISFPWALQSQVCIALFTRRELKFSTMSDATVTAILFKSKAWSWWYSVSQSVIHTVRGWTTWKN